jgi:hypothetical protein
MPKFTYSFRGGRRPLLTISVGTTAARLEDLRAIGQGVNGPLRLQVQALLDTGASMTTVDQSIVDKLKLAPSGHEQFFSNGQLVSKPTDCYEACITILPALFGQPGPLEEKVFEPIRIAAGTLKNEKHGFEALIGMDILKHCVLTYDGPREVFTLDF